MSMTIGGQATALAHMIVRHSGTCCECGEAAECDSTKICASCYVIALVGSCPLESARCELCNRAGPERATKARAIESAIARGWTITKDVTACPACVTAYVIVCEGCKCGGPTRADAEDSALAAEAAGWRHTSGSSDYSSMICQSCVEEFL